MRKAPESSRSVMESASSLSVGVSAHTPPGANLSEKACRAMAKARASLVAEHPFFGALALPLRLKEDPSCRDLWTDGKTLGFNPAYAAGLPDRRLVGAQAHEVLHLAFCHHVRRKGRNKELWNRACDLSINQILMDTGFSLPEGYAHDPERVGMSSDEIYELLLQERENQANKGSEQARGVSLGQEDHAAESMSFKGGREIPGQRGGTSGGQGEKEQKNAGDSVAGSPALDAKQRGEHSRNKGEAAFTGEVRDHPGVEGMEGGSARNAAQQEAEAALMRAARSAANMGGLPAGLARLLPRFLRSGADWRELLRRFLENCADNDYSWPVPNRRYLHQDMYLPSRREARLPPVAVAVDCSGSVNEAALTAFCAEVSAIPEAYDTTLTVLYHDSKVQGEQTFGRMDMPLSLEPVGGGGTDFRPVCEYIAEQWLRPACLIWFTDLECDRFPEEPEYPVLWVCSRPNPQPPPFGELICLSME